MKVLEQLRDLGYEKPRTAVAMLPLSFFAIVYTFAALSAPPEWRGAFAGLAGCYFAAFLALGSEWFWARWFASGLGWSGMMVAAASLVMYGWIPPLVIYGVLHVVIVLMLTGTKMAARYDLQPGWRERFGMDEFGVVRLRKAVTRAAAALPSLIVWALGPREGEGRGLLALVAAALALVGLSGLVRLRTWGVLALGGAAVAALLGHTGPYALPYMPLFDMLDPVAVTLSSPGTDTALALVLAAAALPFAGAAIRYYRAAR